MATIYELVKKRHSDVLDERAVESKAIRFLANKLSYTPWMKFIFTKKKVKVIKWAWTFGFVHYVSGRAQEKDSTDWLID